jgi:hypothetical protein
MIVPAAGAADGGTGVATGAAGGGTGAGAGAAGGGTGAGAGAAGGGTGAGAGAAGGGTGAGAGAADGGTGAGAGAAIAARNCPRTSCFIVGSRPRRYRHFPSAVRFLLDEWIRESHGRPSASNATGATGGGTGARVEKIGRGESVDPIPIVVHIGSDATGATGGGTGAGDIHFVLCKTSISSGAGATGATGGGTGTGATSAPVHSPASCAALFSNQLATAYNTCASTGTVTVIISIQSPCEKM